MKSEKIIIEYIEDSFLNSYSLKNDIIMKDSNFISKNEIFFEIKNKKNMVLLTNSDERDSKIIFWVNKNELNFLDRKKVCKLAANFKIE